MLLTVRTSDDDAGVAITEIRAPDNSVIYSADVGEEGLTNVVSEFFDEIGGEGELAVFLPSTPKMSLEVGRYQFMVVREVDAPLSDVRAFVKSSPAGFDIDTTELAFDLNVWVAHPDPKYLSEEFQNVVRNDYVDIINAILDDHKLAINQVNFFVATASQTGQFSSLDIEVLLGILWVEVEFSTVEQN